MVLDRLVLGWSHRDIIYNNSVYLKFILINDNMKLLSFDVGIKNLSYCLLDDKDYTIEDWGIINISVDPVCEQ